MKVFIFFLVVIILVGAIPSDFTEHSIQARSHHKKCNCKVKSEAKKCPACANRLFAADTSEKENDDQLEDKGLRKKCGCCSCCKQKDRFVTDDDDDGQKDISSEVRTEATDLKFIWKSALAMKKQTEEQVFDLKRLISGSKPK